MREGLGFSTNTFSCFAAVDDRVLGAFALSFTTSFFNSLILSLPAMAGCLLKDVLGCTSHPLAPSLSISPPSLSAGASFGCATGATLSHRSSHTPGPNAIKMRKQAERWGAELNTEGVESIDVLHRPFTEFSKSTETAKRRTKVEEVQQLRLITAAKTPYLPDGRFDLAAYDELVEQQIEHGVEGLVVGGTTGEGQLMNWEEHIMLIAHTVHEFGTEIKVIGNTGSNSTREAIHATEGGFAVGMHAALHINPYYGKTSTAGVLAHFDSVMSYGPTIIYNVPARTGQDIQPSVISELAKYRNFAGVKECTGNERIGDYAKQGLTIWSGNDDQCHDARWSFGGRGVISVVSNLVPGLMRSLLFNGKNDELNGKLMALIDWLFIEPNPTALNTALAQLGVIRPVFRLPYVPYDMEKRRQFVQIVEDIGREHFVGSKPVELIEDNDFIILRRY